jgi:hypothetical protein
MENLQVIGQRSSVLIKDGIFSLVILPTDSKKKLNLMFLWLFAFTVCGMIAFASYFKLNNNDDKITVIIFLAFWFYFEFNIARVYMWKRFGKEKLWIRNGKLLYQQDINGRGKIKEYDLNLISDFELVPLEKGSIADEFSQTFWVKGGERIVFSCQAKNIKFGMQLSDEEATKIISALHKFLKKK